MGVIFYNKLLFVRLTILLLCIGIHSVKLLYSSSWVFRCRFLVIFMQQNHKQFNHET